MKIFGRKKDEEITLIKKDLESIRQDITKANESCEEQVKELSNIIEDNNKEYEKKLNLLEEKYEELNDKLDKIQSIIKLMNELNEDSTEVPETDVSPEKTVKPESKKTNKEHLYIFNGEQTLYKKLSLKGNKIIGARGEFKFDIEDVINIKNNLKEYHDKGIKVSVIGRKYNIARGTIQRVIYNIEEGVFDDIIEEYQNNKPVVEANSHKIKVAESYRVPYTQTMDSKGNLYISTGKRMPYTIQDIMELKEAVKDTNNHSVNDVLKYFDYSFGTACRLIWNIEEGNFDDLIKDWENGVFTYEDKQTDEKQKHFRDVPKSLHKPLSNNLVVLDGGEIINKGWGRSLGYTIQDILELQQRIPDFNNYPTFEDLSEGLDMSISAVKTTVWRIEEGYFMDIINEYLSRNYSYENNFNRLFIDGKNTGLSIDKCISIVECIINANDKRGTVNRLIKMYPTVDSKYIRILSEEYDNPNLSKVLKKEVIKVEKIDNPQKRREQGVYL